MVLDRRVRSETGRSRDGFLSSGVTRATLKREGNVPGLNEALITCVIAGKTAGDMACRMLDGMGSSGHVLGRLPVRILETSLSLRGMKEGKDELLTVAPLGEGDRSSN